MAEPLVMVVEDDRDLALTVADALESEGYRVRVAPNGAEALKQLASEERPALILLDIMMPVMDGAEFSRRQVAIPELQDIPVVVMCADGKALDHAVELGAAEGLSKPVDIDLLFDTVGRMVRPAARSGL